ncbi:MAG: hypothetical protein IJ191_08630 [Treponema sp.]|nr:hypothetical protein [Treponema sp.]
MGNKKLYSCITKATKNERGNPRYSANWMIARRGILSVFENYIKCGNWTITIAAVKRAKIYKTKYLFIPVNVLELETENEIFQFGFNPWANPFKFLKLDYEIETAKLKMSKFSLILRIIMLSVLVALFVIKHVQK